MRFRLPLLLFLCLEAGIAAAHEVRPAYMGLLEVGTNVWEVTWKQPLLGDSRLKLVPDFGQNCKDESEHNNQVSNDAVVERWRLRCKGALETVAVEGLDRTLTDVIVKSTNLQGTVRTGLLRPAAGPMHFSHPANQVWAYVRLGIEHILTGADHLLFVLGLVILVGWRKIFVVVTAFTLAHSATLALAALHLIVVPSGLVETLIAASIFLIAVEIVQHQRIQQPVIQKQGNHSTLINRMPWIIVFFIGLVHGLGFAGALSDIGLPSGQEAVSLLLFNVGIEVGQIAFILILFAVYLLLNKLSKKLSEAAKMAATYSIGIAGVFWTVVRITSVVYG